MAGNLSELSHKELVRMIVEEMEGVVVSDAEGRYLYVNNRWSALTGWKLEDVKGKYIRDVVANTQVDRVLLTKQCVSGHAKLLRAGTGEEVPVYCSYVPLFMDGELEGCLIYMIQISEQVAIAIPSGVNLLLDELNRYLLKLRGIGDSKYTIDNIVGKSAAIIEMKELIHKAARSSSTVLIEGETGSGKELVAHSIHSLSERAQRPFVRVNSAAIPAELLESEFFGYESGAFTGAQKGGKAGKFEMANRGSLFLDEIDKLPLHMQPKLLRALQEREIERLGSARSIPVDVRIIVAGNVRLEELVEAEKFRSDLFYRLNVIQIRIPPLRERREDIPLLADNLLSRLNLSIQLQIPYIEEEAKQRLMDYDWPGNVRELNNVIERAMNYAWCEPLRWEHFRDYFDKACQPASENARRFSSPRFSEGREMRRREDGQRAAIEAALASCGGNKAKAARTLGISRTALYKKLHAYGLFEE